MTTPAVPNPTPGVAPFVAGSLQDIQQKQVDYENQLRQQIQMKGADQPDLFNAIASPLEWVGSKAYWLYSNIVSRPLATALIAGQHADVGDGSLFSASTWSHSYDEAKNVSPGQAMYINARGFFDDAWEKNQLIGQNKDGSLIWDHPDQIQNRFTHGGAAQWTSGGMDALTSWEIDPLTYLGKGAKLLKDATFVKPVVQTSNETFRGAAVSGAIGLAGKMTGVGPDAIQAAQDAWKSRLTTSNLQKSLDSSSFNKFGDYIMANKDRLGDNFSNWAANQRWAKQSAMAGGIAHYLGNATDREEVDAVLATAMGDPNAINSMIGKNNTLAAMMTNMWKQREDWFQNIAGLNVHRYDPADPVAQKYTEQLQAYNDQMSSIEAQTGRLSHAVAIQNQMKNGLYFNSVISPTAAKATQAASAAYHYGESAGLIYNNLMLRPVRLLQAVGSAWTNVRPKGWIKLDDPNSHIELDAQLRESGAYTDEERAGIVSGYINATYGQKRNMLNGIESQTLQRMGEKYGMDAEASKVLYDTFQQARGRAFTPAYSPATIELKDGTKLNAAQVSHDGSLFAVHPLLQTQLENEHPIMDFNKMNSILRYNAPSMQKLVDEGQEYREAAQQAMTYTGRSDVAGKMTWSLQKSKDAYNSFSDLFNHLWKFNAHFRLGYGPRQLADEWLSQAARLGAVNLLDNALSGTKSLVANRLTPGWIWDKTGYSQKTINYETQIQAVQDELTRASKARETVAGMQISTQKGAARQAQILAGHDSNIEDLNDQLGALKRSQSVLTQDRQSLVNKRIFTANGQVVNAFGEGPEGRLAVDLNSGRRSIDSALGGASSIMLNGLRSDLNRRTYYANDPQHLAAWIKNTQFQLAHDDAAKQVLNGMNADQLARWLRGKGKSYYNSVGIRNWTPEEHADRIVAHVNHVLPDSSPEFSAVRQAVAKGADDATVASLMKQTPESLRPMVNEKDYEIATGKSQGIQKIDDIITGWYRKFGETPVNKLSRNPLAATLYRRHVQEIMANYDQAGVTHLSNDQLDKVAEQARTLAIRDVKKYTYNMDFETKIAYMSRFVSPFFGAGQEAINRWARVLAEKPDALGKMAYLYDVPMKAGMEYTYDNRPIVNGYTIDPTTGKKVLVPMDQTMIRFQVPSFLAKQMGMPEGTNADIPLSSLALPFRNKPWYNPGEGPLVQAGMNEIALKSNPNVGDTMQRLGILPVGVTDKSLMQQLMGSTFTSIQTAQDDGTIQAATLQAMQEETWRYQNGLRATPPTWSEVQARGAHMADLKGWFKGSTLMPFSANFQDPYQFFRDQYKTMLQADPQTADQQFYAKYGASAFAFTASLKKNNIPGVPSTANGQMIAQHFKDLIDKDPELAGIIVGDQGGQFSQTAYMQQVVSGQRTTMTAKDAWDLNQANLGWAVYKSYMSGLTAQLYQRGLRTMNDKGAQDLLQQKIALVKMLGSPTMPDGVTPNQFYNEQWTKAYNAFDPSADNRKALAMQQIVTAKELQGRPDIQGLSQYLAMRATIQSELATRENAKPPKTMSEALRSMYGDINAKKNQDLKAYFQNYVMALIEANPAFQTLHDHYLSKDMFDHYDGTNMTNTVTGQQ